MRCYGLFGLLEIPKVIDKAIKVAGIKGVNIDEHFNQAVDMVKIGSGSFRKVSIFRLSRMACMIIAENADAKKYWYNRQEITFLKPYLLTNWCLTHIVPICYCIKPHKEKFE